MKAEISMAVTDECAAHGARKRALWAQALRQRSVWQRACKLGLTAGLLQAAINQGDHWLGGQVDTTVLLKTMVSPVIGFVLVLFYATETWVQKTLEQQGVPLPGHTTH
jgi:hypothetical protein